MSGMAIPEAPVVSAKGLARWYGPVVGLTDIDLEIPPGITGLLGPNGAGKSTLLRILTGQIRPSAGTLTLLGKIPWQDASVFVQVGFCSEDDALYDDLTPMEMVTWLARCSGYGLQEARARTLSALELCGIASARERRCGGFSKGMRQRTRLAAALVHDPSLLLLDEPMTGLDPVGRRDVAAIIEGFASAGRSVIFSSHILHEVESVARHVVILNRGMVLAEGGIEHIRSELADYAFTLEITCDDPRRLARELAGRPHVLSITFAGSGVVRVASESSRNFLTELPRLALDLGVRIRELSCPGENLETLFQRLVR